MFFRWFDYYLVLYIKIVQRRSVPQSIYNIWHLPYYLVLYIKMNPFASIVSIIPTLNEDVSRFGDGDYSKE